jgi:hypothetical protein
VIIAAAKNSKIQNPKLEDGDDQLDSTVSSGGAYLMIGFDVRGSLKF